MGYVFDLDGTLVDSTPTLLRAINTVLRRHGLQLSDMEENVQAAGWGLVPMFMKTALSRTGDERAAAEMADEMLRAYREDPVTGTEAYPGALRCLTELTGRGEHIAVITNKELSPARRILERCFPGVVFSRIYSPDQGFEPKPSDQSLVDFRKTFREEWVTYLGDTELDWKTAIGTADDVKIALWGYRGRERLIAEGVPEELFIEDFSQLIV